MSHYKSRGAFSILLGSHMAWDFTEETEFHQFNHEMWQHPHLVGRRVRTGGGESSGQWDLLL